MSKARILLVEDDFNLGFVIQDLLKMEGYTVHLSKDGKEVQQRSVRFRIARCDDAEKRRV